MRLRSWLFAADVCLWLGWDRGWLYAIERASDATDWGDEGESTSPPWGELRR